MVKPVWIGACAVASTAAFGFLMTDDVDIDHPRPPAFVPELRVVEVDADGAALATAAFGMEALQPETFDEEMVLDIISVSPLQPLTKSRLAEKLDAAEAGEADLVVVLSEIRTALALP
jgi:hypothetical protein